MKSRISKQQCCVPTAFICCYIDLHVCMTSTVCANPTHPHRKLEVIIIRSQSKPLLHLNQTWWHEVDKQLELHRTKLNLYRGVMNLWSLAVTAALVVQVSALVPTCQPPDPHGYCISQGVDNCAPEDRLVFSSTDKCRTNSLFVRHHILPPEWELMFDSYDYESLVGLVFLSREFDNDGDVDVSQKDFINNC